MSEQSCRTCTYWTKNGGLSGGNGECSCPEEIECYSNFFPWQDEWKLSAVGRYANEGKTCEHWRLKNGL